MSVACNVTVRWQGTTRLLDRGIPFLDIQVSEDALSGDGNGIIDSRRADKKNDWKYVRSKKSSLCSRMLYLLNIKMLCSSSVVTKFANCVEDHADICMYVHPPSVAMVLTKVKPILFSGECYMGN